MAHKVYTFFMASALGLSCTMVTRKLRCQLQLTVLMGCFKVTSISAEWTEFEKQAGYNVKYYLDKPYFKRNHCLIRLTQKAIQHLSENTSVQWLSAHLGMLLCASVFEPSDR